MPFCNGAGLRALRGAGLYHLLVLGVLVQIQGAVKVHERSLRFSRHQYLVMVLREDEQTIVTFSKNLILSFVASMFNQWCNMRNTFGKHTIGL